MTVLEPEGQGAALDEDTVDPLLKKVIVKGIQTEDFSGEFPERVIPQGCVVTV